MLNWMNPTVLSLILAGLGRALWVIARIDASLEDIKVNHLPHIERRLTRLEERER